MISNPSCGWCNFKLRTFEGTPSYLTDVPVDLLEAFIDLHTKSVGVVWFDEEGAEFTLVLAPYSIFIIEEKSKPILYDFSEMKIENLEKELIEDIEKDLLGWSEFITGDDKEEVMQHRNEIRQKISMLKKLMNRWNFAFIWRKYNGNSNNFTRNNEESNYTYGFKSRNMLECKCF